MAFSKVKVLALVPCCAVGTTLKTQSQPGAHLMRRDAATEERSETGHRVVPEPMCNLDFPLGKPGENLCKDTATVTTVSHHITESAEECKKAAMYLDSVNKTGQDVYVGVDWENAYPTGCFRRVKSDGTVDFMLNGKDGDEPNGNRPALAPAASSAFCAGKASCLDGTRVCQRPKYINGTANGNGGCPDSDADDGYQVIMDSATCILAADCLGIDRANVNPGIDYMIGLKNASKKLDHPVGCFITWETDPPVNYMNPKDDDYTAMGGDPSSAGPFVGTPLCIAKNPDIQSSSDGE